MTKVAGMEVIPDDMKVVSKGGTNYLERKKKRRRKFKLSKAQRAKISSRLRAFKFQAISHSSVLFNGLKAYQRGKNVGGTDGVMVAINDFQVNYSGFDFINNEFKPRRLIRGWAPLIIAGGARKLGLTKYINTELAKSKIPLRIG